MKESKRDATRARARRWGRIRPRNIGLERKPAGGEEITLMASAEEPERPYVSIEKLLGLYKPRKKLVTLRVDADVLEWFRQDGEGYQTRINRALRRVMRLEMKEKE